MKKGKYGIRLSFYAVLAFLFVIIDQPLLCFAMLAAAVFLEKDEWLGRQTIQAMLLSIVYQILSSIFDSLYYAIPDDGGLSSFLRGASGFFGGICALCVLALCLIGIVNTSRDRDAGIPVITGLAYKAYGMVRPVRYVAPPQEGYAQPQVQQSAPQPYTQQYDSSHAPASQAPVGQAPTGQPQQVPPREYYNRPPQSNIPYPQNPAGNPAPYSPPAPPRTTPESEPDKQG